MADRIGLNGRCCGSRGDVVMVVVLAAAVGVGGGGEEGWIEPQWRLWLW